jgi:biotin transport system ATP-binding protein
MKTLDTQQLSFSFANGHKLLHEISFSIDQGKFVVLSGRNGSGKTILMRCLKGLLNPSSGTIFLDGQDLTKKPQQRNRLIGLVFQDADTQMVGQTVERDILFGLENLRIEPKERTKRITHVTQLMGLLSVLHQRPRSLSGGERRRLAIAGVLVMQPRILMLDEPFANLDYSGIVQVLESLVELKRQGVTILVATHEIEKLLAHADSMILLDSGRIVLQDTPERVLEIADEFGIRRPMYRGKPIPIGDLSWLK